MRTFGRFLHRDTLVYGEVREKEVRFLTQPFWLDFELTGETRLLDELTIAVPVAPSKITAVGLNYRDHIKEMQRSEIGSPLIWFKAPSSLLPHNGIIRVAFPEHKTDFETELAVVIGRTAKNATRRAGPRSCFRLHDCARISAIAISKKRRSNFLVANLSIPTRRLGPFVYTEVETGDLEISLRQNGEVRQQARTSQMIYSVAEIVSFASQSLSLLPGDLILTGTPSGVGPIRAGDELVARVGDWPVLRNRVEDAR